MAKIDDVLSSLEAGMSNPIVTCGTQVVSDKDMETLHVRRKKAGEAQHRLWYLSIAESGQQPAVYWGHKLSDCLKKALAAKGLPTVNKRKPRD